jgi:hypothetical protein
VPAIACAAKDNLPRGLAAGDPAAGDHADVTPVASVRDVFANQQVSAGQGSSGCRPAHCIAETLM